MPWVYSRCDDLFAQPLPAPFGAQSHLGASHGHPAATGDEIEWEAPVELPLRDTVSQLPGMLCENDIDRFARGASIPVVRDAGGALPGPRLSRRWHRRIPGSHDHARSGPRHRARQPAETETGPSQALGGRHPKDGHQGKAYWDRQPMESRKTIYSSYVAFSCTVDHCSPSPWKIASPPAVWPAVSYRT
jgi:hypothetical protein